MNLSAQHVPGYMSLQELTWLAQQASSALHIIEVGSWHGRSTRALADNTRGRVFAVDQWSTHLEDREEEISVHPQAWTAPRDYAAQGGDAVYSSFLSNLWKHISYGNVIPIRLPSAEAAYLFTSYCTDLVFIDADHSYEGCAADIEAYARKVRPGGILAGHDYDGVPWHQGVRRAVDDAFRGKIHVEDTIWWVQL